MIKRLWNWALNLDKRIKFLFVGGLNTLVGVATELIVYLCFGVPFELSGESVKVAWYIVLTATIIAQIVGVTHSYFWNKYFTFQSGGKSLSEVIRFIGVYAVSFVINYFLKIMLNDRFGVSIYISMIVTTFVCMILSYVGHNFFAFKNQKDKKKEKIQTESESLGEISSNDENLEENVAKNEDITE